VEQQGWAPTLAAVREQRRRFETGELHEDPDAAGGTRHPVPIVAIVAASFTSLWGFGIVALVTVPGDALGTGPFAVGLFPRATAMGLVLLSAVIAGVVAAALSFAPIERRGVVGGALALTLVAMAVTVTRLFPFQVPIGGNFGGQGQTYLPTGPEGLASFLPVIAAGALSAVLVALVLGRDRRARSMVAVAVVGVAWVVAGSGVTRPLKLTEISHGGSGEVLGDPDLSIALLAGGVLMVTIASVIILRMPPRRRGRTFARRWTLVAEVVSVAGAIATLAWPTQHVGSWISGRPLRRRRRQVLPPVVATGDEAEAGARWVACAADEKASIRAFEELADQLTRLDAPAALVDRVRRAARDEEHHTAACLAIASQLGCDGTVGELPPQRQRVATPIPRPLRRAHLQLLVRESIVDGMLGEGLAAERLRVGGVHAAPPAIRAILARLAADERSHAALAADIVRWCAHLDPCATRRQIRWVRRRIPADSPDVDGQGIGSTMHAERAGFVDPVQGQQCWRDVRRQVLGDLATIDDGLAASAS